jgi:hypothetical protein
VSEEVRKPFGSSGSEAAMQSLFVQTGEAAKCVPMLGMVGHVRIFHLFTKNVLLGMLYFHTPCSVWNIARI